jgi:hypothetical protein
MEQHQDQQLRVQGAPGQDHSRKKEQGGRPAGDRPAGADEGRQSAARGSSPQRTESSSSESYDTNSPMRPQISLRCCWICCRLIAAAAAGKGRRSGASLSSPSPPGGCCGPAPDALAASRRRGCCRAAEGRPARAKHCRAKEGRSGGNRPAGAAVCTVCVASAGIVTCAACRINSEAGAALLHFAVRPLPPSTGS